MADKLSFSLVSPAQELFAGDVDHVIAPGTDGEFGVLPNHAPFMSTLKNGVVRILEGDTVTMRVFVRGGFADITPAGLTILAEEAIDLGEVDLVELESELEKARHTALSEPESVLAAETVNYLESVRAVLAH